MGIQGLVVRLTGRYLADFSRMLFIVSAKWLRILDYARKGFVPARIRGDLPSFAINGRQRFPDNAEFFNLVIVTFANTTQANIFTTGITFSLHFVE